MEILSRTKMAPLHLHLEAVSDKWNIERLEDFGKQLRSHISHTRHLKFSGDQLSTVVERLVSPAPALESLSLSQTYGFWYPIIPNNIFNGTTPSLTSLKLERYIISWKSPLLKGLQTLEILDLSDLVEEGRPELNDWLDALNEMPQLKELSLQFATPVAPLDDPLISRTVTLPSLTYFYIDAPANDCGLAFAHLVLPALTRLYVDVKSDDREGEDVLQVIPYVVRNARVLDIERTQSILITGERRHPKLLTWTAPGADVKVCGLDTLDDRSRSACFLFAAKDNNRWNYGVDVTIFDALLTLLPMNSVSTLSTLIFTRLRKEFWLRHASRWPLLEQARLVPPSIRGFWEMLAEDAPPDGPRLPSLTRLIFLGDLLTALRRTFWVTSS